MPVAHVRMNAMGFGETLSCAFAVINDPDFRLQRVSVLHTVALLP